MKMIRHNLAIRFTHWVTALSIFVLLFTGFGQMPMYRRYNVDTLPGLKWSSDFLITLNIHYIAAAILIFISLYYLAYLLFTKRWDILPKKGDVKESLIIMAAMVGLAKEPDNDKFLAEQRLAFAVTAFSVLILIITGLLKVYKNLPMVSFSAKTIFWLAQLHNLFTFILLFSIIIHLLAFLYKDNRFLVPSMFTGKISRSYVEQRHKLWLARIEGEQVPANVVVEVLDDNINTVAKEENEEIIEEIDDIMEKTNEAEGIEL
ncbi:MAG TPA: cytochrome b/b6 domain-containing protein [Syntrophomonadaceae bacterium]|nr:cytochrome b/b6 domain-containing protein [Syntrophomonadaceae bacterium]